MNMDEFDDFKTKAKKASNYIRIVDITRSKYGKCTVLSAEEDKAIDGCECLGIMPVITTAANAMYYQKLLNAVTLTSDSAIYAPITSIGTIESATGNLVPLDLSERSFAVPLYSEAIEDETISKETASYFPTMFYSDGSTLDREYLKHIGIVVFKVYAESSTKKQIAFKPVESFVGSLDRRAKSAAGSSIFIEDIVNS